MPQSPKMTLGTAASISIAIMMGWRILSGASSVKKSAVATPRGTAISSAISEDTSVPKMNGSAPKEPCPKLGNREARAVVQLPTNHHDEDHDHRGGEHRHPLERDVRSPRAGRGHDVGGGRCGAHLDSKRA